MKKSTSFRLSTDTLAALATLAERYHLTQTAVIEFLILDRAAQSDREKNTERRRHTRIDALRKHPQLSRAGVFDAGYNAGWSDFQTRHGDNPLLEPLPADSPSTPDES